MDREKESPPRVSQYFQDSASHTVKTRQMVSQIDHFDTIFVSSEFEALVLENSLIKRHMPRYNILLKDDKGYPFVRLSRETYPRFTMVSRYANDSARYFGPFGGRFETRACGFAIWKDSKWWENKKKKPTKSIVAALLKDGRAQVSAECQGRVGGALLPHDEGTEGKALRRCTGSV